MLQSDYLISYKFSIYYIFDLFFITILCWTSWFYLHKDDLFESTFAHAVKHNIVDSFTNKNHIFGMIGESWLEGSHLFFDMT